jgi:Fe2+ transport system protein FeoA
MAEREPLFREEAVEYQKKKASAADLVRLSVGWAKAGFWLVLVAVVAVIVTASIARVQRVALAPAMVEDDGAITALMPAGQGAAPVEGSTATFLSADGGERDVRVVSVEEAVPADEARERLLALALAIGGPVTVVRTTPVDGGADLGQLRVQTGSEPVIVAFVPGLRELFGWP